MNRIESCLCSKSELEIFSLPYLQKDIESGQWIDFHPVSNISDGGPIEFHVSGSGEKYTDLENTQLHVNVKIVKANLSATGDQDKVGPVNLFLHSLFSQVDVFLQDRLVSSSNNTYPYRSFLETLLSYGKEAKESLLTSELYFKDTPGKMDAADPLLADAAANKGLKNRHFFTKESQEIDLCGKLHSDIFALERHLLNGVDLKIKLIRSKPGFCLMSSEADADYKVVITKCFLRVRKVKVSPSVLLKHAAILRTQSAKYPLRRVECKSFTINQGNLSHTQDDAFLGQIPKRIVMGLVDTEAFNGSFKKNPFNFKNFGLTSVAVYLNGEQIPSPPLAVKFSSESQGNIIQGYYSLLTGLGMLNTVRGLPISRQEYGKGYTLFSWDMTPDLSSDYDHFCDLDKGNVRIELKFSTPLPNTINVIVYGEYDNILEVTEQRTIQYDYSV